MTDTIIPTTFETLAYDEITGELKTVLVDTERLWTGFVPIDTIVPNPSQPRRYFDPKKLERTQKSFKHRKGSKIPFALREIVPNQRQPATVIPYHTNGKGRVKWMLDDGERRWRTIPGAGFSAMWVTLKLATDEENVFEDSFAANFCREGHTHAETAHAIAKLKRKGHSMEDIAEMAGKESPGWAYNELRLLQLHPDLLKLMDPPTPKEERLPMAVALKLTSLAHDVQLREWEEKVRGQSKSRAYHSLIQSTATLQSHEYAPTARQRKPSSNRRFIEGKLTRILEDSVTLSELQGQFLSCFAGQDVDSCLQVLRKIGHLLTAFRVKLANLGKPTELTKAALILPGTPSKPRPPAHTQEREVGDDLDGEIDDPEEKPLVVMPSRLSEARELAEAIRRKRAQVL